MKKLFTSLIIVTGFISYGQQLEKSLLWEISGKEITKPSYLFGTIHITCDATLSPSVMKALDDTEQLFLEVDMDDPGLQTQMMMGMMMKDGVTMSSLVNEEDFNVLDTFVKGKIGVSAKMLDNMIPMAISTMFIPYLLECPMQSVESELLKVTKEQKEEVYGLELIADQIKLFNTVPYKEQMEDLIKAIKGNLEEHKEEISKMIELYKQQDIEAMLKISKESDSFKNDEFEELMLNDRNKKWIPVMEKAMLEKSTFFGVGAGHLAGEQGVINLLKKAGYTVKPIK